jgi:hypothetical protein
VTKIFEKLSQKNISTLNRNNTQWDVPTTTYTLGFRKDEGEEEKVGGDFLHSKWLSPAPNSFPTAAAAAVHPSNTARIYVHDTAQLRAPRLMLRYTVFHQNTQIDRKRPLCGRNTGPVHWTAVTAVLQ